MNGECDLDVVVAELERASLELRSAVERRDPCLANHLHARHAAAARLGAIGVRDATPGHLTRITAVIRLGRAIEREIRAWRPWRINPFYARMGLGSFTKGPDGIIRKRDI